MELNLNKEQYERLVKLVYLGNWMINAIRPDDQQIEKYNELEQHVYSFAKDMGMEKYIQFDPKVKRFITNWESEEHPEVDQYIDEYDDENFWHELTHRLAERDMVQTYGEKALDAMSMDERLQKQDAFLDTYSQDFQEHGLAHLVLKK
jgi:hypothetical protein